MTEDSEFWQTLKDARGTGSGPSAGKWELYEHGRGAKKGKALKLSGKPRGPGKALPRARTARQVRAVQRCLQDRAERDPEFAAKPQRGGENIP